MPKNHFQKSLQECLPKMKKLPTSTPPRRTLSSSTSWILRGCKYPKTPSFALDDTKGNNERVEGNISNDDAATLSDIDRFLMENFKSLYKNENDVVEEESVHNNEEKSGGILIESPRFTDPPPEINLRGSNRFFVSPVISNSLMEEARNSLTIPNPCTTATFCTTEAGSSSASSGGINESDNSASAKELLMEADDFITVLTYSPNPYDDFKRSMQEMVEARLNHNGRIDWEFMEELLFCFLNLNDKKSYRFILRAFVDMIVVLRENQNPSPGRSRIVPAKSRRNVRSNRTM